MEAENAYTQRIEEMTAKLTEAKTLYSNLDSDFQKTQSDLQVNQVIFLILFLQFSFYFYVKILMEKRIFLLFKLRAGFQRKYRGYWYSLRKVLLNNE